MLSVFDRYATFQNTFETSVFDESLLQISMDNA